MKRAKVLQKRLSPIPSEILFLIFLELPIKSLLKFKCVCKEWVSIMEGRDFVDSRRLKSRISPAFLRLRVGRERNIESPDLLAVDSAGNLEATGIQLVQSRWSLQFAQRYQYQLPIEYFWWRQFKESVLGLVCFGEIILNPSTKEAIKLPDLDDDCWNYIIGRYPIVRHDMICYRLGFDAPSNTYKAVVLFSYLSRSRNEVILLRGGVGGGRKKDPGASLQARVLTLGIDSSWRKVNVSIPYEWAKRDWPSSSIRIYTSLFLDNRMFFLISHYLPYEKFIKPRLLVFGIQDEKFRLLGPLPGDLTISVHVFEWNGQLAVISTEKKIENGYRDAWILEDHENETWIKRNIPFDTTKYDGLTKILTGDGDLLITEYVETIFPLKQAITADQHVWRWGSGRPPAG